MLNLNPDIFQAVKLDDECQIYVSNFLSEFQTTPAEFEQIWDLHPEEYHTIRMLGKEVKTPRWQQSYGADYNYTGSKNNALPVPDEFRKYLHWCKEQIDRRLNGFLLNWYDGQTAHYIGAHRDSIQDLEPNSPIVTISLGEERVFRMRPHGGEGYKDLLFRDGEIIVIPWNTNLKWTHEVPHFKKYRGRRISITLRAYTNQVEA